MVPDPYLALHLPHTATVDEIKRSYHDLARCHHPDRFVGASEAEKELATQRFTRISEAYELLSDPDRKARYDHIYKFGGYDDEREEEKKSDGYNFGQHSMIYTQPRQQTSPAPSTNPHEKNHTGWKRKATGIGYTCVDPLAYWWTNGQIHSKMAVCGVQIPSRLHMTQPVRFAFSSSHYCTSPTSGARQYSSTTTQYVQGKTYTRTETTTVYADGRKEVRIQGDDLEERRFEVPGDYLSPTSTMQEQQEPWYMGAWHGIKDRLAMCYSPCTAVTN